LCASLPCLLHSLPIPSSYIYHPNNTWWNVRAVKLFIMQSFLAFPPPSKVQIFCLTFSSQIPSIYTPSLESKFHTHTNHQRKLRSIHGVAVKFPEWFYCVTYREPCNVILIKTHLCVFQLAPVMISVD
jgi:hypothetical protein